MPEATIPSGPEAASEMAWSPGPPSAGSETLLHVFASDDTQAAASDCPEDVSDPTATSSPEGSGTTRAML